ncbi:MAG: HTH domain-containing protein [Myxococcota bacterium]
MTFTEAAVEVLRLVGKPLHYKKITEIAIEKNLLSHVGKTPEITMSSRLATMVKKDRGDAPIMKVKPGVFGLREFSEEILAAAESESGHEYELPEEPAVPKQPKAKEPVAPKEAEGEPSEEPSGEEGAPKAAAPKLPGADVFPEEEDDDEPILAKIEEEEAKRGDEKRTRKRRRRKRKGSEGEQRAPERPERTARSERGERSERSERSGRSQRSGRSDRGNGATPPTSPRQVRGDWDRTPDEGEAVAQDLADSVEAVLGSGKRNAMNHARIAEQLIRRKRLSGSPEALAPTVAAAILGDDARRRSELRRPRFRSVPGGVALTDWQLPADAVRAEEEARRAADRQRDAVHRAFLQRISDLPATPFMELIAAWLNGEGIGSLRGVRAPSKGGYHLTGTLRHGGQETRVAVVIWRDGTAIGREHVIDVRGALHHYDNASTAWLLTTGRVQSGAREEAAAAGQAPCVILDGGELATAMERLGLGLQRVSIPVSTLDFDLLESLNPTREAMASYERKEPEAGATPEASNTDDDAEASEGSEGSGDEAGRRSRRRRRRRGGRGSRNADREEDSTVKADGEAEESEATKEASSSDDETPKGPRSKKTRPDDDEASEDQPAVADEGAKPEPSPEEPAEEKPAPAARSHVPEDEISPDDAPSDEAGLHEITEQSDDPDRG